MIGNYKRKISGYHELRLFMKPQRNSSIDIRIVRTKIVKYGLVSRKHSTSKWQDELAPFFLCSYINYSRIKDVKYSHLRDLRL